MLEQQLAQIERPFVRNIDRFLGTGRDDAREHIRGQGEFATQALAMLGLARNAALREPRQHTRIAGIQTFSERAGAAPGRIEVALEQIGEERDFGHGTACRPVQTVSNDGPVCPYEPIHTGVNRVTATLCSGSY